MLLAAALGVLAAGKEERLARPPRPTAVVVCSGSLLVWGDGQVAEAVVLSAENGLPHGPWRKKRDQRMPKMRMARRAHNRAHSIAPEKAARKMKAQVFMASSK